jgi:hypothetical protein
MLVYLQKSRYALRMSVFYAAAAAAAAGLFEGVDGFAPMANLAYSAAPA